MNDDGRSAALAWGLAGNSLILQRARHELNAEASRTGPLK